MIPMTRILIACVATAMLLGACGSSARTSSPPVAVTPPPPPPLIVGVATPSSVAVVTAQNAGN
jgi:hypothetical protein